MPCLSHRGRGVIGLTAWRAQQHGRGWITGPVGLFDGRSVACRELWEAPDVLKGPDNHLDTHSLYSYPSAISALPAQMAANTNSLLEAMMSIRFLPAEVLPSGDKVVSTPSAAC